MFSDGVHIGVIVVDVNDRFTVKFLNACNCSSVESELPLKLARKSIDVFGSSIIEEGKTKHQVDFASDDDVLSLQSGKEFALMLTSHGRIYYTGTYPLKITKRQKIRESLFTLWLSSANIPSI